MKSIYFSVLLFFYATFSFAQVGNPMVGLDQWRIHLPYNDGKFVSGGNDLVYCATQYALCSYKKSDASVQRYSRLTGLSDFEISTIRYSAENKLLLIAYESSDIDLLYDDGTVVNIPDIKLKNIVGGKGINNIFFINQTAYLSCDFGIVVVDLIRHEIRDTYYIGPGGTSVIVHQFGYTGARFYAATDKGLLYADASSQTLFNYESWSQDTTMHLLADPDKPFTGITYFDNNVIAVYNDTLKIAYDGTGWREFTTEHFSQSTVDVFNGFLSLKNYFSIAFYENIQTPVSGFYIDQYPHGYPVDAYRDVDNYYWIADANNGFMRYVQSGFENIYLNSPTGIGAFAMDAGSEGIWVVGGGLVFTGTWCADHSDYGTYWFNNNEWKSFNKINDPLYSAQWDKCNISVAVDPKNGKHAFVGMRNCGLMEYGPDGGTKIYNSTNSTIKPIDGDPANTWIAGVDFDSDGNLWVASNLNSTQLNELTTAGTWKSYNLGATYSDKHLFNVMTDSYHNKWINARGAGLIVFNENDPDNPSDNLLKLLTTVPGQGGLPSSDVFSLAEDKEQAIWVGSSAGVFVIYNPGNIFTGGNYDAQKILLEQDGHAQYLLETEVVTAIAVDGANRKWFGTKSSGVYLMSPDGTKMIHTFNTENSPLPSNDIASIAIDPVTGEVFFGTGDKGICSYRGDATDGGDACDHYYVFPNPVKHDYHGSIAITGLVANASVKITDVSGQVVYQTKANGGQAVWNGNNFDGKRAQTGIYMVFVTNDDGSETCVTKMVFTN
jgi:hypothetical protein